MNKLIRKILAEVRYGVRNAVLLSRGRPYVLPAEKPFALDAGALRRDMARVSRDLNVQFRK